MNIKNQHPKALYTFFITEMWERYGFYVVQTLLSLYLVVVFKWDDKGIYILVGTFTALTYLSPLFGGYIADHWIGQKKAITCGFMVLVLGYYFLSIITTATGLNLALAGIAMGTGLIKPNISSLLGNQYPEHSIERESGFTIFYMGITSGIILGTTIPFFLHEYTNWSFVFLSASVGVIFAILIFMRGCAKDQIQDCSSVSFQLKNLSFAGISILFLWVGFYFILSYSFLADLVFCSVVLISFIYFYRCIQSEPLVQAKQTLVIGLLCIISTLFWAFYFQMFSSLTLFIARIVDHHLFHIPFPPPYYVGIQSIGMIILGVFIRKKTNSLDKTRYAINSGTKFVLALILMLVAYAFIAFAAYYSLSINLLSPMMIIPSFLIISKAELLLSPVGLSAISLLANRNNVSTMIGIFFVSLGLGGYLSGKLAAITSIHSLSDSLFSIKMQYYQSFKYLLLILFAASIFSIMLNQIISWLMSQKYQQFDEIS